MQRHHSAVQPRQRPVQRRNTMLEHSPHFWRATSALLFACLLLSWRPSPARAGNEEGVLIGNESAITGGAVTAVVADGSAGWYNPAGIALVDRNQVDVSGSATQLRLAATPQLLQSASGQSVDGGYYELNGIPSSVTIARRLEPGLVLSLGVFVPSLVGHTDRVRLTEQDPMGNATSWQLVQQENTQSYYAGLTLGIVLASNLRVGFTVYGLYRQTTVVSQFFGGSDGLFITGVSSLLSLQSAGIELGGGLQWEIIPGLHLGVSVRTPALQLGSLYRRTETRLAAGAGEIFFEPIDESGLEPRAEIITPTRIRMGLAWRFDRGWVGIDADISHELNLPEFGIDRAWVVNVRAGGRYNIDDNISVGGGLFTDLSSVREIRTYGETSIDYLGGAFGVELRTPHALGEGEQAATLVFAQTFALRYAYGEGAIGGLRFDVGQPENAEVSVITTRTTVHELSLYLGSALYF